MKSEKSVTYFSLVALLLFPTFILVSQYIAGITFLLAVILGCRSAFLQRQNQLRYTRDEVVFFFALSLLAISALISAAMNDVGLTKLDRLILPLLAIPIYYLYRNNRVNEGLLWCGLVSGAVVAGLTAMYQVLPDGGIDRAGGITNPIMFGDVALVMGFMSMAGCGWFFGQRQWLKALPFAGLIFGLLASALSLSRGGWLALPVAVIVFVCYSAKRISLVKLLAGVTFVIIAVIIAYQTPQFKIKDRIETTVKSFHDYVESDNVEDPVRYTGLGIRLDMWKTSWYIFKENPLFGVGWGSYGRQAEKYVARGLVQESVMLFPHPHNQFLSALAKGGLIGLLAVILFFTIPLILFYRQLSNETASPQQKRIALAGLVFLLSFIVFALTEAVFERSRMMTFYAFYLTVLMALMKPANKAEV